MVEQSNNTPIETMRNEQADFSAGSGVLLLGDDGRMMGLLSRRFAAHSVTAEKNILDGILVASRTAYPLILINAERLGEKTSQAVKAVRRVAGDARIILYSEPFAEIYARAAVRAGADDYLIWPVPASELKQQFNHRFRGGAAAVTDMPGSPVSHVTTPKTPLAPPQSLPPDDPMQLKAYRELAGLVPQGIGEIAQQASILLPQVLGVKWVKVSPPEALCEPKLADDVSQTAEKAKPENEETDGEVIALPGSIGGDARIILGPPTGPSVADTAGRAKDAADFLATLFELAQRDECLKRLAIIDELTGAYNRRYLEYFLRQVIEQGREERTEVTLLLFDIDDFKHYNDTYGHAAGDEILRQAARLIKLCCRRHDVVARIGGDEFGVLFWDTGQPRQVYTDSAGQQNGEPPHIPHDADSLPNGSPLRTHQEISVFLSNRFRRIMRTTHFPSLGPEARGMLTISGGLTSFPWDGDTVAQLMAKADQAMLTAKRSGKNRIYLVGRPQQTTP